jgi:ABC-type polysaccharide/polyol phosphate export permease/Tfp pilus assembly protein PilF
LTGSPDARELASAALAAAEADPANVGLLLHAAQMQFQAGDAKRAKALAQGAVSVDPGSVRAVRFLSGLLDAIGERGAAINAGRQAVALDPEAAELRFHLGNLLAAERRWREAAEHLSVHVVSPAATAQGWRLLASVLQQAGDPERATEAARHAVAADPTNIEYRVCLASLLSTRAQFDAALDELAVALDQDPRNALAWRARSGMLAALDRLGEALQAAERAAALAPDDKDCLDNLAFIARQCHQPIAASPVADAARWTLPPRRHVVPRPEPTLGDAIAIRWRVAYAIMLRDIRTRFGHMRLGYLWAILEPIAHLLTLGTMFFELNSAPPPVGDNLFLFYVTGLIPYLMYSHVSYDVMGAAEANNVLLLLPIVKRTDVMVAQAVRQLATELCVGIVIFATSGLLGQQALPADLLTCAVAVLLLWVLAIGVGAIGMVVSDLFPSYRAFYDAMVRLLYFASGIYFSPLAMPDWVRAWLVWNPILQGIDLFRSGFFAQYEPHWLDVNYLLLCAIATIGIGFAMERSLRGKMVVQT